jgi:hypothetical protein
MEPGKPRLLLEEDNIISLRTAMVTDDGNFVSFYLMPAWLGSSIPRKRSHKDLESALSEFVYLYRHLRSPDEERALTSGSFPPPEFWIKPLSFVTPPALKLAWADSGNTVALYLNAEPWAFIYEETHESYSKGIYEQNHPAFHPAFIKRGSMGGKPWNQYLFEKVFQPNA